MEDNKGIKTTNAFQKIIDESHRKPNKIWVDNCAEFYHRSKKWLQGNNIDKNVFNT